MKATFENLWAWSLAHDWTATLAAFAVKSTLVLLGAWLLLRLWRNASAAMRHWVWLLALLSLFLLPLRPTKFAIWSVPMWQRSPGMTANNELASVTGEVTKQNVTPVIAPTLVEVTPPEFPSKANRKSASHFSLSPTLVLIWLGGFVFLLSRFLMARLNVFRLGKLASPIVDKQFCSTLNGIRAELRLRRTVRLLRSAGSLLPMTWGVRRPIVLLPDEAESWSAERLQIVLRHELAHVKRRDCLTQAVVQLACAFGWFNPLAWIAARQVRIERERACDDLVLESGAKPSSYAEHLLDISRSFASNWFANSAAIAIAHKPQIAGRIVAIVDARRNRRPVTLLTSAAMILAVTALLAALSLFRLHAQLAEDAQDLAGKFDRLKPFFAAKERQARELLKVEAPTNQPSPLLWKYFAAAANGDWTSVTNLYWQLRSRAYQFSETTNSDPGLENTAWQPVNETHGVLGLDLFGNVEDNAAFGRDIISSIPAGSIYFGGTDPGRWIITAMSKSHEDADPFFTLTQNGLSDGLYLKYLRLMYGGRIYIPTDDESKAAFDEYLQDAQTRMSKGQLRPGEDIKIVDGKPKASGQVAVMAINALLAKKIFDANPDREFYIEESFPLEWMYPRLTPNGLIMKLNRQPLAEIPDDAVRADREYWSRYVVRFIGDWLRDDTSVAEICRRVDQMYGGKEIVRDHKPPFRVSFPSGLMFAKLRSSIAGVYSWRANGALNNPAEKERMTREADFAFRQAYALGPHSPEALYRYVQLLASNHRYDEAILLAQTSSKIEPGNPGLQRLVQELQRLRKQPTGGANARPTTTVTGRVVLRGTPPPERTIVMDTGCAGLNPNPVKTRHYLVGEDGGLADVFVHVKKGAPRGPISSVPRIVQSGCLFEPYVLGVQTGQPFELRNTDPVLGNVHFLPRKTGNRERNISLLSGKSVSASFDVPELFIQLKADVHSWMFAYICVVDHPWFAVTDQKGNFTLPPGLVPGHYTLAAVHRKAGEQTVEVNVKEGDFNIVNFTLDVP